MQSSLFTSLLLLPLAAATNHTDDGLSAGEVTGIVIGSLATVVVIGGLIWYFFFMKGGAYGTKKPSDEPVPTSVSTSENHIPMVALRIDDDEL